MKEKKRRKRVLGEVASDKMDKTITVKTSRLVLHPRIHKHVKRDSVFKAHDEKNEAQKGDLVEIAQCRPLSKTKFWRLVRIIRREGSLREEEQAAYLNAPDVAELSKRPPAKESEAPAEETSDSDEALESETPSQ